MGHHIGGPTDAIDGRTPAGERAIRGDHRPGRPLGHPDHVPGWQRELTRRDGPGRAPAAYDPGGMIANLFLKLPGWRAREGYGPQPVVGFVGEDACPPACAGAVSRRFGADSAVAPPPAAR